MLQLASKYDPNYQRTVPVWTKPDLIDKSAEKAVADWKTHKVLSIVITPTWSNAEDKLHWMKEFTLFQWLFAMKNCIFEERHHGIKWTQPCLGRQIYRKSWSTCK
jgi:hypothetical protein